MPKGKTQKQHKSGLHSNRIENYCPVRTNRLPPRYVDLVGASDQRPEDHRLKSMKKIHN